MNELFEHYKFIVDPGQEALRIDKYLQNFIPNFSRTKIRVATENGNVFVNNLTVKQNYKVKPNDEVLVKMEYPKRETELIPENIPLDILFEDDFLLVLNKPSNMVVHPAYGNYSGTLINALLHHFGKDFLKTMNEENRPGLVHRLDKNTTGLMVIAKTPMSLHKLSTQFANRTAKRKYVALTWGNLKEDVSTIEGNIGRNLKNRKIMQVFPEGDRGKHAITTYKVLERFHYVTLAECVLKTGRTHQIRAHFRYIKHPLFNDDEYGGNQILKGTITSKYKQFINNCFEILPRQALHAKTLGFIHPKTNQEMFFESELPKDLAQVIDKWKNYQKAHEIITPKG